MSPYKVLIIRFSSIGDIVLTTPVIRCLKEQKGAEIHYLTKKPFAPILQSNPHISKVYTIQKKVGEILPKLRKEQYDYIIDLHHNLRTFLIKWSLPFIKSYSFKKLNFEKWLVVNFKINRLPKKHIVDRYLATVKPLGVINDHKGLEYYLEESSTVHHQPFLAIPIGAGRNTKALTIKKIITICESINSPIILLGGKQEIEKGREIEKGLNKPIINLVGQCSLADSAAIVKEAAVVLTGDTGLMHIAAAFHRPIVSIWGNTIPEFGMSPYYPKGMDLNTVVEVKNLACRPCSKIGFDTCPKGHFKCIEQLNVAGIVAKLKETLSVEREL